MLEEYDGLILKLRNAGKESFLYSDLMREAADIIEELSRENESLGKDLTSAVEMLKKKRKPKWIPVSERLPEAGEWVLCYCRANIYEVLKMRTGGDWVHDVHHIYMHNFVTHWMPLPSTEGLNGT